MPGRSWRAGKPCGDGKPEGPDRPLEKGVGGIKTGHQMPGRSWRAGKPCGDGKPEGPDRPLEKGVGGIKKGNLGGLTRHHQMPGRVRVFARANTWRTQRPHGVSGFGTESQ